jgi:hypothetical protein
MTGSGPAAPTEAEIIEEVFEQAAVHGESGGGPDVPKVTEAEERAIRADFEKTIRGRAGRRLHPYVEEAELPLCESEQRVSSQSKWRKPEPFSAYPIGYKEVCRRCGHIWRRQQESDA